MVRFGYFRYHFLNILSSLLPLVQIRRKTFDDSLPKWIHTQTTPMMPALRYFGHGASRGAVLLTASHSGGIVSSGFCLRGLSVLSGYYHDMSTPWVAGARSFHAVFLNLLAPSFLAAAFTRARCTTGRLVPDEVWQSSFGLASQRTRRTNRTCRKH
jgi:hypothetical protein